MYLIDDFKFFINWLSEGCKPRLQKYGAQKRGILKAYRRNLFQFKNLIFGILLNCTLIKMPVTEPRRKNLPNVVKLFFKAARSGSSTNSG
jgi:hypothetical protein